MMVDARLDAVHAADCGELTEDVAAAVQQRGVLEHDEDLCVVGQHGCAKGLVVDFLRG